MDFAALAQRLSANRVLPWVAVAVAGTALHLLLWQFSEPTNIFSDFFKAYYPAGMIVWQWGSGWPPWSSDGGAALTFVNMPILAWLFVPIAFLDKAPAGWTFLGTGIVAALAAWALLARMSRLDARNGGLLLLMFMLSGPMVNSLREGNTTHLLLLLLVVALLLWRAGSEFAAGLVLGFCAVVKLPLMLYGVYFVVRRRWRVVAGGATMIVGITGLSVWYYGRKVNLDWYQYCVEPFFSGIIAAFNVQSVDGFLYRLVSGTSLLRDWKAVPLPIAYRIVRTAVFAAVFAATFWLIWRADRRAPAASRVTGRLSGADLLGFSLVLNLAVVASPISWTHYYLLLLLPWSFYLGGLLPLPEDATTHRLMWGGLVLSSLPVLIPPTEPGLAAEVIARTIVSAWLFGGLLMLAALMRGAWRAAHPGSTRPPVTISAAGGAG